MADNKPSTSEILALIRKQGAFGSDASGPAEDSIPSAPEESTSSSAGTEAPGEQPVSTKKPAAPARRPESTAGILAAARAAGAGGATASTSNPASGSVVKPAAKPKSTADILAAARGGGTKPAPVAASTEESGQQSSAIPAGERPSVSEMVKAARSGGAVAAPVEAAAVVARKPRFPSKPLPVAQEEKPIPRRSFPEAVVIALGVGIWSIIGTPFALAWLLLGLVAIVGGLGMARFMMPNMIVELPSRFKVGPISDFPPETVSEKFKASRGVWIVNTDTYNGTRLLYALSSICTHLGCTPNWLEGEQKYKCPCHGSGFYINGINFEGPAPRPLERVGIEVAADGLIEVDKSVKFQEELGQWQDGKSFIEIS